MLLFQIIIINLIVSFDNIGIIAIASRNLSPKKAHLARQLGIWLSLALKLLFTIIMGYIFDIPWLHIRLIGGIMLLYIVYSMIKENDKEKEISKKTASFIFVIFSIIAADISMSLDNVVAVLALVVEEYGYIGSNGIWLSFLGFAISIPILLFFSEAVMHLITKSKLFSGICAGYLTFLACNMIFEDDLLVFVFRYIKFPYSTQVAIIFGIFIAFYTIWDNKKEIAKI